MSSPDSPRSRRRIVIWLGLAAALLLAAGAGAYVLLSGGDVSNPDVEFRAEPTETPAPEPAEPRARDDFVWPLYGYTPDPPPLPARPRSRCARRSSARWSWNANSLLEFTPVIAEGKLYLIKNNGAVYAIDKRTGRSAVGRDLGTLAASAPAYGDGRIYVTILERDRQSKSGPRRRAAREGRQGDLWSRPLPSRTESSPLLADGRVYFGSEDGTVYALRAARRRRASGATRRPARSRAGSRSPTASSTSATTAAACTRSARATASGSGAVTTHGAQVRHALGPVLREPGGRLRPRLHRQHGLQRLLVLRRHAASSRGGPGTGGYVYASAAVAQVPGGKPTVYVGSYDGRFYALDARVGQGALEAQGAGPRSPAPRPSSATSSTSATSHSRTTTGLGARTGRKVFRFGRGGFNPVVSDGRDLYVVGYASLSRLRPRRR